MKYRPVGNRHYMIGVYQLRLSMLEEQNKQNSLIYKLYTSLVENLKKTQSDEILVELEKTNYGFNRKFYTKNKKKLLGEITSEDRTESKIRKEMLELLS
jgi:hypothetical protein